MKFVGNEGKKGAKQGLDFGEDISERRKEQAITNLVDSH